MENKLALRRSGRITGIAAISHLVLFQLLSGALLAAVMLASSMLNLTGSETAVTYLASDAAMALTSVIYLVFYLVNRKGIKEHTPVGGKIGFTSLAKYAIIILGANAFFSAANTLFTAVTGLSLTIPETEAANCNPWLLLAAVAVFPAIAEELIFRGVIYRYLRRHGAAFAAAASSLIFGLIHLNFLQLFFAFVMGLVLCRVYERSGKLRYCMLLHFFNNSLTVLINVLPVSRQAVIAAECIAGAAAGVSAIIYLAVRNKRKGKVLPAVCGETVRKCRWFFTSVPMLLLAVLCLAVCVLVVFI